MERTPDDFHAYKPRSLPHWRLGASTYFVTWRLAGNQPPLSPDERDIIDESLAHFDGARYEVWASLVMDDHVHAIVTPFDGWVLERLVHGWKSYSAHRLSAGGRAVPVWQKDYFDRIIRDESELEQKTQYVLRNAQKRWPDTQDYRWVYPPTELST